MRRAVLGLLDRTKHRIIDDFRTDPYLPYILVLAAVLAGFWFWHLVPNTATRDARPRLLDPMITAGAVVADPSLESLEYGITTGRTYGATLYLYGIALIPVFLVASQLGQFDAFVALDPQRWRYDVWYQWHQTPRWIWTWSILIARLITIALAVGCVYLTYRIGVAMRDRTTGRLAALLLTFTFGFLVIAHEVGEDVPSLFFVLLVVYLALRYVQTGEGTLYLTGCAMGGIALAFKLTAVPVVGVLGAAYLLRARNAESGWRDALVRPHLIITGMALGAATTILGFPTAFVAGVDEVVTRAVGGAATTAAGNGPDAPIWWWFLRGYLTAFGLPLFAAIVGGVVASVVRRENGMSDTDGRALLLTGVAAYLLLFSQWADVRAHHLLPTFPLLVLLLAATLAWLRDRTPSLARPFIALLVVTSGAYAVTGDIGYATQPRDQATKWLNAHASENATIEFYHADLEDVAVPHWMRTSRYATRTVETDGRDVTRTEWMYNVSERCPTYIELTYQDLATLRGNSQEAAYIRDLLANDTDGYRVAADFGPRPPFLDGETQSHTSLRALLRAGVIPRTIQYGDDQDLGIDQYIVILQRTDRCGQSTVPRDRSETP